MKNVLIVGAGLVSRPMVVYLLARTDARLVVASRSLDKVHRLLGGHPRGTAVQLDLADDAALEALLRDADLVVSLAPYAYHVKIARLAIRRGIPMVTTSYVSPEMRALGGEAQRAGVLVLNEMGLDPGLDHMSTMQVVDRVRALDGKVTSFSSCCGGLPAPEANDNPWGYKFSWSPAGVLLAGRNPARYLRQGRAVEIPGPDLFRSRWPYEVEGLGLFEIYPNRDSLGYRDVYGISEVRNMFRGTIRNPGWCDTLLGVTRLGLLDDAPRRWADGATYADLIEALLPEGGGHLVERLAAHLECGLDDPILARLEWAGLFSRRPLPMQSASPLELMVDRLRGMMSYRPGERDMIALRHEFVVEWDDRSPDRVRSLLVAYGDPDGDSAMAKTVSLPAAVAVRLLLEGKLPMTGVQIPVHPEIYVPVLGELAEVGIRFEEVSRRMLPTPFDPPRGM